MKKNLLTILAVLAMSGMAVAQTETLLTTITATAKEQASYSTANMATVSFSYTADGSSAYLANWGWWGYGWIATVTPAEGYTITKCIFYDDANRTATDSEAPFVVETTEEDKTPRINGTPIDGGNMWSKGIKKIDVYGYVTPTAPTTPTAPSDINLHRNEDGSWSFIMPGRNLVMSTETFSTNDTVNGHYLAGVPEGWLILALGDTVPVSNDSLRRTTPITEGAPVTIVPTGNLRRIKSITLVDIVTAPEGVINGKFTVSASGDQVYFSKGNLKYNGSAWSFFDNQYDYYNSYSADAWDKFGWSTSATTYGMNTSTSNGDYSGDFVDWGATMGTGWRMLTSDEWTYLLKTRSASTVGGTENGRYAKAKVNNVGGVILFPDTYTHPDGVDAPIGVNATDATGWNGNSYTAADWTKMETAGCVFLPAAGDRNGSSVFFPGTSGFYWSATPTGTEKANEVYFSSSSLFPTASSNRSVGSSVRLVRPTEAASGM